MCYFYIWDGWMDGEIQGLSLNNRSLCLVWKPCLPGCLRRRGAMLVDMLEQAVRLLLAKELKRQWICKDWTGTGNGCQSTQQAERTKSLKTWRHKLLGMGETQAVLGSSPLMGHLAAQHLPCLQSGWLAMKALPCFSSWGPSQPPSAGASDTASCRGAAPFGGDVSTKEGTSCTAHAHWNPDV